MSLLSRIHANKCLVRDCTRERATDTDVCRADLNEKWQNRLNREPDGSYTRRRTFTARDETRLAA
jgi:hypothetical protein